MASLTRGSSFYGTVQNVLPASLGHKISGMITDGVPQGQCQDNVSLYSTSHALHVIYDIEDVNKAIKLGSITTLIIKLTAWVIG